MSPGMLDRAHPPPRPPLREPHVLLTVQNQAARYLLADLLLEAGYRLTLASSYGLADVLIGEAGVDLLVTAQPAREIGEVGLPQLARAVRPDLPILVLEEETAGGPGVLDAIQHLLRRWPMPEQAGRLQ